MIKHFLCILLPIFIFQHLSAQKLAIDLLSEKIIGYHNMDITIATSNNGSIFSKGVSNFHSTLNGKYTQEDFSFVLNEAIISGTAYLGFSDLYNRYELTQVDNKSKSMILLHGTWDDSTHQSITFANPDAIEQWGLPYGMKLEWKYRFISVDNFIKEIWLINNGIRSLSSSYNYYNALVPNNVAGWHKDEIKLDDGKIVFEKKGEGEPILLINGGPGWSSAHIKPFGEMLSNIGFQVIIFDQRGTGGSRFTNEDSTTITFSHIVEDMEKIRKKLNFNHWIVIGHSFGGMLAMDYAKKYPKSISKVLLMAPGGYDLSFLDSYQQSLNSRLQPQNLSSIAGWSNMVETNPSKASLNIIYNTLPAFLYNDNLIDSVMQYIDEKTWNIQTSSLMWNDLAKESFNIGDNLRTFEKPVLILQGKQDALGEYLATTIRKKFINAELILINECAHIIWVDNPDESLSIIRRFLNK
ncbi:MAG: alpha/beta fold hydrolase [Bacteroidetes bacterium]|nr:alpha/beta fold hydrolase [Bacteroidota bacterium]HAO05735.1 hypothetical protein [Chryseobacterium sp.]